MRLGGYAPKTILTKLKDYTKRRFIGTQYEWESHIDNIFDICDKNLKAYTLENMLDVGCGKGDRTLRLAEYLNIHAKNVFGLEYDDASIKACEDLFNVKKIDLETEDIHWEDNTLTWSSKNGHPVKRLLPKKNYSQKHLGFYIPKTNGDGDYYKTFRYT